MKIPKGATVLRLYDQPDGTVQIVFEDGDPRDYIWTSWSKSNWKSIDWLLGRIPDDQYGILKSAKNTEQVSQPDSGEGPLQGISALD